MNSKKLFRLGHDFDTEKWFLSDDQENIEIELLDKVYHYDAWVYGIVVEAEDLESAINKTEELEDKYWKDNT